MTSVPNTGETGRLFQGELAANGLLNVPKVVGAQEEVVVVVAAAGISVADVSPSVAAVVTVDEDMSLGRAAPASVELLDESVAADVEVDVVVSVAELDVVEDTLPVDEVLMDSDVVSEPPPPPPQATRMKAAGMIVASDWKRKGAAK